jgi:hypothetical protein
LASLNKTAFAGRDLCVIGIFTQDATGRPAIFRDRDAAVSTGSIGAGPTPDRRAGGGAAKRHG